MLSGTSCTPSKECWMDICKKSAHTTPATIAQDGILVRTLTSDFWVDWALLPLFRRSLRLQGIQSSQGTILLQNALVMGKDPSGGLSMQYVSCTQFDTHPGGGNWVSYILWDIALHSFTDPHTSLGVPGPNTLVDSQLHQMHLKHPT